MMMKTFKMMISALLILVMLCGCAMAASYKANVFADSMKVYNASKEVVGSLPMGTEFTVKAFSKDHNWALISYKGKIGAASMKNIMFQDGIKAVCYKETAMTFVTKASFAEKTAYKAKVALGTVVNVVGYYDGCFLVANETGNSLGIVNANCFKKV